MMINQKLVSDLESTSSLEDVNYTNSLKSVLFSNNGYKVPDDYLDIINCSEIDTTVRFSAFYCLFTKYRRREQSRQLYKLVDDHIGKFTDDKYKCLVSLVYSQYLKFKYIDTENPDTLKTALKKSSDSIAEYGKTFQLIGCYNNYADVLFAGLDLGDHEFDSFIPEALKYVDKAIKLCEEKGIEYYSRYYYSKAKLLRYQKQYSEAKKAISLAIKYENTNDKDSMIRISDYHNLQLEIRTAESLSFINADIERAHERYDEIQKQIEQQQGRYIEIIGFFAATIALISAAVSTAQTTRDFSTASGIIISLAGCLTFAYAILKLLFQPRKNTWGIIIAAILSAALLFLGCALGFGLFAFCKAYTSI